ncbi:pre-mRNA-splicing factor rse1 [Fusarium torreyae]|uniref:Pre-mRNA-splicing factor rse1 n=1 Tax=Fusarium torreyae TaxID=1237075 RepID=A0A9W8SCK8_9HYPO|nr:pre-mRNA-splicing factor rse1 [Fusarium torreyae]
MATTSNMFLYSLTVQPPTNVTQAVLGQFAGTTEQLIITGAGSQLSLLRPDPSQGKVITLLSHDVFGISRFLAAFRLAGSNKAQNRFQRLHLETFGKSGVQRVIPGEYLACDPNGRACLIASAEKNKLVYVLNRNSQAELTISSPLEAHKPGVLVISMVALDVGYSNPVFAALEIEYSEADQDSTGQSIEELHTQLVYYELDLCLHHVVRKWSDPVDPTASLLFQVPGGNDGPSGVLVCGDENVTYRHLNQETFRVAIPRRRGATEDPNRKRTIMSGIMHKLKGSAGAFFFLLQTEDGDLFKLSIDMVEDDDANPTGEVKRLKIKYFDTVPMASSLCILKSGFLYVASQFGNYLFYQFEKLGDDDEELEFYSDVFPADPKASHEPICFYPRPIKNLALVESIPAMNPLLDCKVANLKAEDAPQIYTICGNGARSSFRMLKYGLEVNEVVTSELPEIPSAVWTLKLNRSEQYDAYIVLSFTNSTLVLSIGEIFEEVNDSGFLTSVPALAAQLLGDDGLIQVHPKGIRHARNGHANEWAAPPHRSIVAATANAHQVAVALSSGEIVYFEMDVDGLLAEYDEKKEMFGTVTCLSLGDVPEGRLRSLFLAVGCDDCTVRVLSLNPESTLENKSVQALTAAPTSLAIIAMTVLDEVTGELTDTRQKLLGPKEVRLFQVTVKDRTCVLGLSSRPWLGYADPITNGFVVAPLSYVDLEWGWNFSSEQCEEGIVGIQSQSLRLADPGVVNGDSKVLTPEELGYPKGTHRWASWINVIDPLSEEGQVLQTVDFENNEADVSAAIVSFASQDNESLLVVGNGKDMVVNPRSYSEGYLHIYRFQEGGRELEFIHKTKTEEPPLALLFFQGRVAVAVGTQLRIYDLGMRQMLHKSQAEVAAQQIVSLNTQGSRIVVGDVQQGVTYVVYKPTSNKLIPFVDDTIARWTTCTTMVDYESVAGGDKFGNMFIVRCPETASEEADEEQSGLNLINARDYLHGTPHRLSLMCHFYTQDIPTSIAKTSLVVGGQEILLWSGLVGTIGVFIRFISREDTDFFQSLEQHLRTQDPPLAGRDHLMYRSYYAPVKGVIDGDLCERYNLLPNDKKQMIAGELDRSVREIERKFSDIRTRSAF